MVTLRGELDRTLAGRILRDAFMEMQPQAENFVWFGWQSAISMLGLPKWSNSSLGRPSACVSS
jgi:hypothetical protein